MGFYRKISDNFLFGSPWPKFKIAEVDLVYRLVNLYLVNAISEVIEPSSSNSVCGFFMGSFRMSSYVGHLDQLSTFEFHAVYKLVNAIACEIVDPKSHNSVCGFFMEISRMTSYLGQLGIVSRSLRSTLYINLLTFTL